MRRLPAFLLTIVAAVAVAACSSGAAPGWTYAPAASATPAPSGAASGGPSTAPSAGASEPAAGSPVPSASAQPVPSASGGAAGLTVKAAVNAATSGFDPTTLETAAGAPFTLTFDNEDNTVQHNLVLQDSAGTAVAVQGDTKPFTGPGDRVYQVPALTAGEYKYVCQVHPGTMTGTLTVK
jgi:plastocyanin